MEKNGRIKMPIFLAFIVIVLLAIYVRRPGFLMDAKYRDVYFSWLEGKRIVAGVNPYEALLESDMVHNQKYPTRLPLIYLMTASLVKLGFESFESFIRAWRILVLLFDLAVGSFLFYYAFSRKKEVLGLCIAFIWFFNRWNLYTWEIGNEECLILFLMLLSVYLWEKKPLAAGLLFGAALGIKHFGVLFLPVLLAHSKNPREGMKRFFYVMIIPVIVSFPFFIWSPEGFSRAIFFNLVRKASTHVAEDSHSIRIIFGSAGLLPRIFIITAYILFWFAAIRKKWNLWLCGAVAFFIFQCFNPVLFSQYFAWMVPFFCIYLVDAESVRLRSLTGTSP